MKILVPIKAAAELDEDFEMMEDDRSVDPDFLEYELNDWDRYAIEAALQLVEAEGGEVVVVTVGDEEAEPSVLTALATGCARAIRVWDGDLAGADVLTVGRLLASVIERETPDLVLCGAQSSDGAHSATGVAAAGFMGMRHAAVIRRLALVDDGRALDIERELEGGEVEEGRMMLPALLTVQTGINAPRYATLRAVGQAREKPMEILTPQDLGLDAEELRATAGSVLAGLRRPSEQQHAQLLDGSPSEIATAIKAIISETLQPA